MGSLVKYVGELDEDRQRVKFEEPVDEKRLERIKARIAGLEAERDALAKTIPESWKDARARFDQLAKAETTARRKYRQNVDESYDMIKTMRKMVAQADTLAALQQRYDPLIELIRGKTAKEGIEAIKALESELDALTETHRIKSKLSRAKRALRGDNPDQEKAIEQIRQSAQTLREEVVWHQRAAGELGADLDDYHEAIRLTIGMRMQERLTGEQAEAIAECKAVHKDLTLFF